MMKLSSRKFPLNYLPCLFYILKPQDATIWSLLYTLFFKLSSISGFLGNLRRTDKETHIAKSYQKIWGKWIKAKHDVHFLHKCKSRMVYPKLVPWRNINNKTPKERDNYNNKNLTSTISNRRQKLKLLT